MRKRLLVWIAFVVGLSTAPAAAQQGAVAVQLPTFSQFTVDTSVLVPDSGAGYRAYLERLGLLDSSPFSTPWNSRIGAPAHQPKLPGDIDRPVPRQRRASTADHADESVAAIRRRQQTEDAQAGSSAEAEVTAIYERGKNAERAGKPAVARIYYQMAARRATGPLRDEIVARLKGLASNSERISRKR